MLDCNDGEGEPQMKWILLFMWIPTILAFAHAFYPSKEKSVSMAQAKIASLSVGMFGILLFTFLWTS